MRHLKTTKKFKRTEEDRKKLWIDLSRGLIRNGSIVTFTARGKWFRTKFERLITLCKRTGDDQVLAFRRMRKYFSEEDARKMVSEIAPRYKDREGGYTKLYKLADDFSTHDKCVVMLTD